MSRHKADHSHSRSLVIIQVPEWGGAEQEVSSGATDWADCGEQIDEVGFSDGHVPQRSFHFQIFKEVEAPVPGPSEMRWSRVDATPSEKFACPLLRYPANLKRRANVPLS